MEKPTFKRYIGNRCLIPADGFYEWMHDSTPIRFTKPNDETFCFAGLFYETKDQTLDMEVAHEHVILLTTTPNKSVGRVHNRMPFIVQPSHYDWWLSDGGMFETVLTVPDRDELNWCPVQKELNKVNNEGPELIRPSIVQKNLFGT